MSRRDELGKSADRGLSAGKLAGVCGTSVEWGGAGVCGTVAVRFDQRRPKVLPVEGVGTEPGSVAPLLVLESSSFRIQGSRGARSGGHRCSPLSPNVAMDGAPDLLMISLRDSLCGIGDGVLLSWKGSSRSSGSGGSWLMRKRVVASGDVGTGGGFSEATPIVDFVPLRLLKCNEGRTEDRLGFGVRITSALVNPTTCFTVP